MTVVCGLSILAACNRFYPRPLRQSGNQGTARIVQPVHRRKPRSIFDIRQQKETAIFNPGTVPPGLSLPAGNCLSLTTSLAPDYRLWLLSCRAHFQPPRACPAYFKGGVTTLKCRPLSGTLVCAGPVLHGEHSALPVTRHCQVVWG